VLVERRAIAWWRGKEAARRGALSGVPQDERG
jgi:hypothetical protein